MEKKPISAIRRSTSTTSLNNANCDKEKAISNEENVITANADVIVWEKVTVIR
jgi:hypothetical protein